MEHDESIDHWRRLVTVAMAQVVSDSVSTAVRQLAAIVALTTKGVAEGWEPADQWQEHVLADAYRRVYTPLPYDEWRQALIALRCIPAFKAALRYERGVYWIDPCLGRDAAVVMLGWCTNARVFARYTASEALAMPPNVRGNRRPAAGAEGKLDKP